MSRTSFGVMAAAAVTSLAIGTACAAPPAEAIDLAEQAEIAAVEQDAAEYAPEAMNQVAEARAALDAELAVQAERWSVRRSYQRAEELAMAYEQASVAAATAAGEATQAARSDAQLLIEDTRHAIDEVRGMLALAPVGKGSRADLAMLGGDLDLAASALMEAELALQSESFLEARSKASGAREGVERVRSALTQATTMRAG